MRRGGIHRQLLVAGVIPAVVVTIVVSTWLIGLRVADLGAHQRRLGQVVASQLAPAAEYGVFSGNTEVLRRLADAALVEADLRAVTIRDRNGMVLAAAGKAAAPDGDSSPVAAWLASHFVDPGATAVFRAPVVQPTTDLGEFDLPGDDYGIAEIGSVEIEIALLPAFARQLDVILTGISLALAGLLASLFLARRLGDRIGEPVRRLANAMRRAQDGDLGVRVAESSKNELGLLESGLNRMADEIQRTQRTLEDRIERATHDLQQTIAALEISNVELDLARKRALEASHLKSEFLAAMSHEIRTPMSGIIGFTNLLGRTKLDPAQRDHVLTIQKSAETLMRILNDVLDLSRIEAGKLALADAPLNMRECIDDVLSLLAPLAYAKGLDLRRGVSREVPTVLRGDAARIQQVLTNLVGNAIKYTPDGSVTVEVTLHPHSLSGHTAIRVAVIDTGIGIAVPVQRLLFQAFAQASPSTADYPGTGLGLVIANKLVEAMGGEISLESEPGEGSCFGVVLNLRDADGCAADARWRGRRVLVCDEDPLTRDHLAQLVEAQGACVDAVATPPRSVTQDAMVFSTARADPEWQRVVTTACAGRTPVVLANTHDPIEMRAISLPRCGTVPSFYRALDALLGVANGTPPTPTASLGELRLLVVEDNRINRVLLVQQLEALGAAVVDQCATGEEALTRAAVVHYDAALIDLQMPGIDGLETARRLHAVAPGTLVLAVTANVLASRDPAPRASGIVHVLVKPVDEQRLTALLVDARKRCAAARTALDALDPAVRTIFREDFPAQVAAFRRAIAAGDDEAVAIAVHDLAGTAGACQLRALADALEAVRSRAEPDAVARVICETTALQAALVKDRNG
ncbi:MAG: ATP-binding protein [Gammaproteobacteria bacterium]